MNWELLIRLAGAGLLLIALANVIAPSLLDYAGNLAKVDRFFGQVFRVHAVYLVGVVLGMAAVCLLAPRFFLENEAGPIGAGFLAVFWGSRVVVQLTYYDRETRARFAGWDLLFLAGFAALGVGFTLIAFLP